MHYRAAKDVLEYREDVQMRSEDMVMQGASIDVILAKGGGDVIEVAARGDVTIETTEGKAAGDDARYLPEDESMTVSGEKAWLENDGKLTEGKQLTFFLTDDKILVDGQEQRRTKTTYTSKPRPF
jgi:lipopolysaccharide export system protein LptA